MWCDTKFVSKESTFALRSTTEALDFFVFDGAHFVIVVPSQLLHGFDTSGGNVLEIVCRGPGDKDYYGECEISCTGRGAEGRG